METEKVNEESHLSGAYIRSLVKHLTTKDGELKENGEISNITQKPQRSPKKQVRRRLHTSKPYQERLLNMAEARREIVTALKFHRASMKQQESTNNVDQLKKSKSRKIHTLYPSTTSTSTTASIPSYWPISTAPPPPLPPPPPPPPPLSYNDSQFQDLILPSQTLGLTLNFKNFNNLDTDLFRKPLSSMYSSSSTSTSTSSVPGGERAVGNPKEVVSGSSGGLHHAMDDDEMEEIRSLGEQHQIEWNDRINLVTSARWCNFLKNMEIEYDGLHQFDQIMEFPPWLINANESSCVQQEVDGHQDPALPCMDIGEIEGMDGEWLA